MAPDPALGSEHGILLMDETSRDESPGTESNVIRHVRAKIFSNEARSLGDIEIPFDREHGILKKWWGYVLLPDGTSLELKQDQLKEQELVRIRGDRMVMLKASLPGTAPGCVIDYGYQYQERGFYSSFTVDVQQTSPVKEFRYRWSPYLGRTAAFLLSHGENLGIQVTSNQRSILVTAKDLPAVLDEPQMPPESESHASATFYYRSTASKPEEFWDLEAKRLIRRTRAFAKEKPIADLVASMKLPPGDLPTRLKAAYGWLSANIRNTSLLMSEEAEAGSQDGNEKDESLRTAADVIRQKEGTGRELDGLFFGVATALGAEAGVVLATNRQNHYFNPKMLAVDQFDWTLIGVKAPGDSDEHLTFVDLGSGLPYGEIPWWLTGSRAFMASPAGDKVVILYPTDPKKSVLQTNARISFNLEEGTASMSWTSEGSGQVGLSSRWRLRGLKPEQRQKELDELCGTSADNEVSRAEAPNLQNLMASFHLECETTLMNTHLSPQLGSYEFGFAGPYITYFPRFSAPTRKQIVIFDYPRIESLNLDVVSPPGFEPAGAAPVPAVESPYGRYALFISTTPEGYHVQRMFALVALVIPPQEYPALKKFLADVAKADDTVLPFKRKGPQ